MNKPYALAALGGTFDRLHAGHQHFLETALTKAEALLVGVTTPEMNTAKAYAHLITPYETRALHLAHYLTSIQAPHEIVPLTNVFGETLTNLTIDALAVTDLTRSGDHLVNRKRHEQGMPSLPLIIASMLKTTTNDYLSSSLIRAGLIDRSGFAYLTHFSHDLRLSEKHRQALRRPQGKLLNSEKDIDLRELQQATKVATVGDVVTQTFLCSKLRVDYALVDFRSNHMTFPWKPQDYWNGPTINLTNPAGQISCAAATALFNRSGEDSFLGIVSGEEDLLALPMVLCLPLGSLLYYGQPHTGIVELHITEELKQTFHQFLSHDLKTTNA